jgi:hypothetical protein
MQRIAYGGIVGMKLDIEKIQKYLEEINKKDFASSPNQGNRSSFLTLRRGSYLSWAILKFCNQ